MKATIKTHPIIETEIFYCESVSYASDYELGRFIPQYDEKVLSGYLTKKAKIHESEKLSRTYIVRDKEDAVLAGWFSLAAATLPYQENDVEFQIPAINLSNFAVDKKYKQLHGKDFQPATIGEFIFNDFIIPISTVVSKLCGAKEIYIFSLKEDSLIEHHKSTFGFIEENDMESMILLPQPHYYNNNSVLFLHRPLAEELSVIPGKINLHDEQVTMEVIV